MYDFWYDYVKPKYGEKFHFIVYVKNFAVYIKTDDVYKDIPDDVVEKCSSKENLSVKL